MRSKIEELRAMATDVRSADGIEFWKNTDDRFPTSGHLSASGKKLMAEALDGYAASLEASKCSTKRTTSTKRKVS